MKAIAGVLCAFLGLVLLCTVAGAPAGLALIIAGVRLFNSKE